MAIDKMATIPSEEEFGPWSTTLIAHPINISIITPCTHILNITDVDSAPHVTHVLYPPSQPLSHAPHPAHSSPPGSGLSSEPWRISGNQTRLLLPPY